VDKEVDKGVNTSAPQQSAKFFSRPHNFVIRIYEEWQRGRDARSRARYGKRSEDAIIALIKDEP
jgi:hypothetical protein